MYRLLELCTSSVYRDWLRRHHRHHLVDDVQAVLIRALTRGNRKDQTMLPHRLRLAASGAVLTVLSLFGGLLLGVLVGNVIFDVLPGHNVQNPDPVHVILPAVSTLAVFLAGSAVWGMLMGRLAQATNRRRMALAGMLGFAPITIGLGILLQILEPIALQQFGDRLPLHRMFTLFFVPTAFLISGVSAWAIGIGLKNRPLARTLFWRVGFAVALAFLILNLVMEASGWVVGAPRAADRFTMLTVMFVGDLGAALAGGAMLGWMLARESEREIERRSTISNRVVAE